MREPRYTAVALALGAAGLALLAPELLGERTKVTITGSALAAVIARELIEEESF